MKTISALMFTAILTTPASAGDAERNAIGVLAEGYARNREAFPFIDCRFDWMRAKAPTVDDALKGKFIGDSLVRHGHWLVSGPNVRYEVLCDPAVTAANMSALREDWQRLRKSEKGAETKFALPVNCMDRLILRSDAYSLKYGPFVHAANLFSKTDQDGEGIRYTPFNIDILGPDESSNPGRYLRDCLNGRFQGRFLGTPQINGVDVLVVTVGGTPGPTGEPVGPKFGFDPKRGYLPVYISDTSPESGKRWYEAHITEARQCTNDRWFPTRVVKIISPDTGAPYEVEQITVLDLDVDSEPSADRFQLELAAGTQVNVIERTEWTNLRHAETFRPEDLAALHERCIRTAKGYQERRAKAMAAVTGGSSRLRTVLIVGNVGILAAVACVLLLRRRKSLRARGG